MIEAPSHLIRAGGGRIRVLRLAADGGQCWPLRYTVRRGRPICTRCGCTNKRSCIGGCQWVDRRRRLCSRCAASSA